MVQVTIPVPDQAFRNEYKRLSKFKTSALHGDKNRFHSLVSLSKGNWAHAPLGWGKQSV
jgi:hypothetical protein